MAIKTAMITMTKYIISYVGIILLTYGIQRLYIHMCMYDIWTFLFSKGSPMCDTMEYFMTKHIAALQFLQFSISNSIFHILSKYANEPSVAITTNDCLSNTLSYAEDDNNSR